MSEKIRKSIPTELANQVLYDAHMTCCVCRVGQKNVQLHHIDSDPSNNIAINLAPLCLECHDKAHSKNAQTRNLTPELVRKYKTEWEKRVSKIRDKAHELIVEQKDDLPFKYPETTNLYGTDNRSFLNMLVDIRKQTKKRLDPKLNGTTIANIEGTQEYTIVMLEYAVMLSRWFHPSNFKNKSAQQWIIEQFESEREWGGILSHPHGLEQSGTIRHWIIGSKLSSKIDLMIEDMVEALTSYDDDGFFDKWQARWRSK